MMCSWPIDHVEIPEILTATKAERQSWMEPLKCPLLWLKTCFLCLFFQAGFAIEACEGPTMTREGDRFRPPPGSPPVASPGRPCHRIPPGGPCRSWGDTRTRHRAAERTLFARLITAEEWPGSPEGDGWGIFFLPTGQALVSAPRDRVDVEEYREYSG